MNYCPGDSIFLSSIIARTLIGFILACFLYFEKYVIPYFVWMVMFWPCFLIFESMLFKKRNQDKIHEDDHEEIATMFLQRITIISLLWPYSICMYFCIEIIVPFLKFFIIVLIFENKEPVSDNEDE